MAFFCWKCSGEMPDGTLVCPHCQAPVDKTIVNQMETLIDSDEARIQIITGVTVAGRYEIKREIGRGGMGIVYLAFDRTLEREVALKVIPYELCQDPRAVKNLKRETNIALGLSHPRIVRIHNLETWEGQAFVTMEYVTGGTLAHLLDKHDGFLSYDMALPLIKDIAAALDYAHQQQPPVIHRDLKPLNILITADGCAKIADYGLAHALKDSATRISMSPTAGTLAYMAPEQMRGKGIGPATDIYAFACLICEILTGDPPFSTGDLRWQIIHEEPELPESLPDQVKVMLLVALAKDPAQRPASALALVAGVSANSDNDVKKVNQLKSVDDPAVSGKSVSDNKIASPAVETPETPPAESSPEGQDENQNQIPESSVSEGDRKESLSRMGIKSGSSDKPRTPQKPEKKSRGFMWVVLIFLIGAGIAAAMISAVINPAPVRMAVEKPASVSAHSPVPVPKSVSEPVPQRARSKSPAGGTPDDTFESPADKAVPEAKATLYINSEPADARVRILNIGPVC